MSVQQQQSRKKQQNLRNRKKNNGSNNNNKQPNKNKSKSKTPNNNSKHNSNNSNQNHDKKKNNNKTQKHNHKRQMNSKVQNQNNNNNNSTGGKAAVVYHSSLWSKSFLLLVFLLSIAYNEIHFNFPSLFGGGTYADTKPFATVDEFYPFYLTQHANDMCRKLHVTGTTLVVFMGIVSPESTISVMIGALVAYLSFPLFRGYPNGIFEALVFLVMTLVMSKLHGCMRILLVVTVVAYGFAWVGHFMFEHNKPATFLYPTYSLICDFKMCAGFYRQLLLS